MNLAFVQSVRMGRCTHCFTILVSYKRYVVLCSAMVERVLRSSAVSPFDQIQRLVSYL